MSDIGFHYSDENGIERAAMDEGGFWYWDENGNTRAQLGNVRTITPSTGAVTPVPGFAL
jgi:hypothetical protein